MEQLKTERLIISPVSVSQIRELAEKYRMQDIDLCNAYEEMLNLCLKNEQNSLWYAPWEFCLKDGGTKIGYAGFKGLWENGGTEIGYGIEPEFEGRGFATEGAAALCRWALTLGGAQFIEAETDGQNPRSEKVLLKLGFSKTGKLGLEGPRYILNDCSKINNL